RRARVDIAARGAAQGCGRAGAHARARAGAPSAFLLEEEGARLATRAARVGHRVFGLREERGRTVAPVLADGVEREVEIGAPVAIGMAVLPALVDDAPQDVEAGVDRRPAAAHALDDRERRAREDRRLAAPGAAGRADLVVAVEPGAHDRGVADAPRDLPGEPARGRAAAQV